MACCKAIWPQQRRHRVLLVLTFAVFAGWLANRPAIREGMVRNDLARRGATFEEQPVYPTPGSLRYRIDHARDAAAGWVMMPSIARVLRAETATAIHRVELRGSQFADGDVSKLRIFDHLEVLALLDTTIGDEGLRQLQGLSLLRLLTLRGGEVTAEGLRHLSLLPDLEYLLLERMALDADAIDVLAGVSKLSSVEIRHCALGADALRATAGWRAVRTLSIVGSIDDDGLAHLQGMPNLYALFLTECKITDAAIPYLCGFTQLYQLNVQDTEISKAGLATLRTALPKTVVLGFPSGD